MMNCQKATRLLSDSLERELTLRERASLRFHTMMCSGCRNFGKQMGSLRDIAHHYAKCTEDEKTTRTSNSDQCQ